MNIGKSLPDTERVEKKEAILALFSAKRGEAWRGFRKDDLKVWASCQFFME